MPCASSGERTLTTTRRLSAASIATNTRDIPPPSSSRSSAYASPRVAWSCCRRSVMSLQDQPQYCSSPAVVLVGACVETPVNAAGGQFERPRHGQRRAVGPGGAVEREARRILNEPRPCRRDSRGESATAVFNGGLDSSLRGNLRTSRTKTDAHHMAIDHDPDYG